MTDIEQLRQNVIDAARAARDETNPEWLPNVAAWDRIVAFIDALDAAEKPDPWQIIEREIGEWQSVIASHKSLPGHRGDVNVAIDSIEALTCLLADIDEGGNDA